MELDFSRAICTHFYVKNKSKGFFDKLLFPDFWKRYVVENNNKVLRVNSFKDM